MDGGFPSQRGRPMDGGYGGRDGGGRGGFRGNEHNAKTKMCMRWQSGDCRFGDNCNFAHGEHELRAMPPRVQGQGRGRREFDNRGGAGPGAGYYQNNGPGGYGGGYGAPGGYGGAPGGGYGAPPQGGFPAAGGYGGAPGGYAAAAAGPAGGGNAEWAAQGYPVPGPGGWVQYQTAEREAYYHNTATNETTWEKPPGWR